MKKQSLVAIAMGIVFLVYYNDSQATPIDHTADSWSISHTIVKYSQTNKHAHKQNFSQTDLRNYLKSFSYYAENEELPFLSEFKAPLVLKNNREISVEFDQSRSLPNESNLTKNVVTKTSGKFTSTKEDSWNDTQALLSQGERSPHTKASSSVVTAPEKQSHNLILSSADFLNTDFIDYEACANIWNEPKVDSVFRESEVLIFGNSASANTELNGDEIFTFGGEDILGAEVVNFDACMHVLNQSRQARLSRHSSVPTSSIAGGGGGFGTSSGGSGGGGAISGTSVNDPANTVAANDSSHTGNLWSNSPNGDTYYNDDMASLTAGENIALVFTHPFLVSDGNTNILDPPLNLDASGDGNAPPVPEPATMLLIGAGLAGIIGSRIRRKK